MSDFQIDLVILVLGIASMVSMFLWKWHNKTWKWVWFGFESAYGWLRAYVAKRRKQSMIKNNPPEP